MLIPQAKRYAMEICDTYKLERIMVICAKGHEIAYFIYQKGFSDLHSLTDKYDSHKDLICLVFKDNTIKPIPQLNTVNIQIQILDMGL